MKKIFFIFLLFLPVTLSATNLTLKEDADLIGADGAVTMTVKKGEAFRFQRIEEEWVHGSYTHEIGIARGRIHRDKFNEQDFISEKSAAYDKEMTDKGFVRVDGKWVSPEEIARIEREKFEQEQAEKGLIEFEGEWMTPEERDRIIKEREAEETAVVDDPFGTDDDTVVVDVEDADDPVEIIVDPSEGIEGIDDPFTGTGDGTGMVDEPEIEDLIPGTTDETPPKKTVDFTKSSKQTDEDDDDGLTPEKFARYILPGMVGMGIILVLIVFLSTKRGSRP